MATATVTLSVNINPSVYGQSVGFTAVVTGDGMSGVPEGTVTFKDGGSSMGTRTLVDDGNGNTAHAVFNTASLGIGTHTIHAHYNGDGTYDAADEVTPVTQIVNKTSVTVSISEDALIPILPGVDSSFTYTAVVTPVPPGSGTPTGTIDFYFDGVFLGTWPLSGAQATLTVNMQNPPYNTKPIGNYLYSAVYAGDALFDGATGFGAHGQDVGWRDCITFGYPMLPEFQTGLAQFQTVPFGETFTVVGAIAMEAVFAGWMTGVTVNSGTMSFYEGATLLGTAEVADVPGLGGRASLSLVLPPGVHTIRATWVGEGLYWPCDSDHRPAQYYPGIAVDYLNAVITVLEPTFTCSKDFSIHIGASENLVANGGFETGDFTAWTRSGEQTYLEIDGGFPKAGNWALLAGPTSVSGLITQVLPTEPGRQVALTFWYRQQGGGSLNNHFVCRWNGVTVIEYTNHPQLLDWSVLSFTLTTLGNDELQFEFFNPPSWWDLDVISVVYL